MTDNTQEQPVTGATEKPTEQTASGQTPISSLPPDIQQYIETLRKEAEGHRKAQKAAEKAAKEAEETQLANDKKWQELAETRRVALEKLQPVAEQHEAITAAFNASLDNRLKQIPDDVRSKTVDPIRKALTPVDFSNWLDANLDLLRARPAPSLDGGAGGTRTTGDAVKVTPDAQAAAQLAQAYGYNVKPEAVAKRAREIADNRARRPQPGQERDTDKDKE